MRAASLRFLSVLFAGLALQFALPALGAESVAFPNAAGETVGGFLARPDGAGPFPAVALLHSCLGLPSNRSAIEAALADAGFVALFVDEFSGRGLKDTCTVDFPAVAADAAGALAYLARRPDVDPERVAVVGFSQGGDGALAAAASPAAADGLAFRAAAAFYPPCANESGRRLRIPTLVLIGEKDTVTPPADCRRLVEGQANARLIVVPGAAHCFDDPAFAGGKRVLGMTLRYDPAAARQAMAKLIAFLEDALRR